MTRGVGLRAGIVIVVAALALAACAGDEPRRVVTVTADPGATASEPGETNGNPNESNGDTGDDPAAASSVDAAVVEHAGNRYRVVTLPLDQWDVRVEWPDPDGVMLRDLLADRPDIAVVTNAGIFSDDLTPGGLLIADGKELQSLNLNEGGGNFHLLPNAVFAVSQDGAAEVVESHQFDADGVTQATQSGPALLLDGVIHPEFNEESPNLAVRSGVGVSPDGATVYLAISLSLTTFWDFAGLFSDELGVEDALYLDGDISALWVDGDGEPGPLDGPYAGVITATER